VLNQYSHVLSALETVSKSVTGETAPRARGLLKQFQDAQTLLGLEMAIVVLPLLQKMNKSLQSRSMTVNGMSLEAPSL